MSNEDTPRLLNRIAEALRQAGIDLDTLLGEDEVKLGCVVVAPNFKGCIDEVANSVRDHVVMVRVDESTAAKLDDWVQTGAVKSRSEAAAVFIKVGLEINDDRLRSVADALREVDAAKRKVAERMKEVFGDRSTGSEKRE